MTQLLSISLSLVILMQSFGISINDIAQIDELVEHAQFHNEQYGDNILVFIAKHYGELKVDHEKEHQEEKEDHEQLPFQQYSQVFTLSAFVLNNHKDEFKTPELSEFKTHNFFYQEPSSTLHSEGLLQPPRQS